MPHGLEAYGGTPIPQSHCHFCFLAGCLEWASIHAPPLWPGVEAAAFLVTRAVLSLGLQTKKLCLPSQKF
eukprot:6091002-Amphidinium_carterae.1